VAELGRTPAMAAQLHSTFGKDVAVLHAQRTREERSEQWHRSRDGGARGKTADRSGGYGRSRESLDGLRLSARCRLAIRSGPHPRRRGRAPGALPDVHDTYALRGARNHGAVESGTERGSREAEAKRTYARIRGRAHDGGSLKSTAHPVTGAPGRRHRHGHGPASWGWAWRLTMSLCRTGLSCWSGSRRRRLWRRGGRGCHRHRCRLG